MDNLKLTSTERKMLVAESQKVEWFSMFEFLKAHNGYRKGCLHLFLGTAGGGKSTLVRSLILDALSNTKENIALWLSEESSKDFATEISFINAEKMGLERLVIASELEGDVLETPTVKSTLDYLERFIIEKKIKLLFLDNITTSKLYMDRRPDEQSAVSKALKSMSARLCIPFVIIAHTGANTSDNMSRLIDPNDIRGSKTIVNLANFFYVMQRFTTGNQIYPTLKIHKHRGQQVDHKLFFLKYYSRFRIFKGDDKMPFSEFKQRFKEMDKL